jgi:ubiquitin-protein ligase
MVTISSKRKERDLMKLMMSNYEVTLASESKQNDFYVVFRGPVDSPYEGVRKMIF